MTNDERKVRQTPSKVKFNVRPLSANYPNEKIKRMHSKTHPAQEQETANLNLQ